MNRARFGAACGSAICASLLLAACTRLPAVSDGLTAAARAERLRAIESWEMRGRLTVDTGERAFQARFNWRQDIDTLSLIVRGPGPLGSGSFRIDGTAEELTLLNRGEERVLTDPEFELSAIFGWWLPVTSLPAWLVGIDDPRYPADFVVGPDQVPAALMQRLWQVRYEDFQINGDVLIPRNLSMTYDSLRLELRVDDWHRTGADDALN